MNFKKFISGVSAFAIAASAFAGMAVTANAASNEEKATVVRVRTWSSSNGVTAVEDNVLGAGFGTNSGNASTNYPKIGVAQFSFNNANNAVVESAKLTYTFTIGKLGSAQHTIYSAEKADVDFSQVPVLSESAENQNGIYTQTSAGTKWTYNSAILGTLTKIEEVASPSTEVSNDEIDVTDYVKAQAAAGTNYATFAFTNCPRGAVLTNYELNITYKVAAENEATVTLNLVDGNGKAVSDPVTVDKLVVGDSFDPSEYAPATLKRDITDANGTYHQDYAYGSADSIESLAATQTVDVTYAASGDPYVYVTWNKGTSSTNQFAEHKDVEKVTKSDDQHRYNYQKYLNHNNAVYSYSGNGSAYKCTPNKDQTRFLNYSLVENGVFFVEGENINAANVPNIINSNASYSGGKYINGTTTNKNNGTVTTLASVTSAEGGIYKVTVAGKKAQDRALNIKVDDKVVNDAVHPGSEYADITVPAGSTLTLVTTTSNAAVSDLDYVLIERTGDLVQTHDNGYKFEGTTIAEVLDKMVVLYADIDNVAKKAVVGKVGDKIGTAMSAETNVALTVFVSNIPENYKNLRVVLEDVVE